MNQVNLIGRLTKDPEKSYIDEKELAVAKFTLAIDRPTSKGKDKAADFIRVTVFGRVAENCGLYLSKGRKAAVSGRIQTGSYKNNNGDTVYTTEVIANNVEFLEWGEKKEKADEGIPEGFIPDDEIPF